MWLFHFLLCLAQFYYFLLQCLRCRFLQKQGQQWHFVALNQFGLRHYLQQRFYHQRLDSLLFLYYQSGFVDNHLNIDCCNQHYFVHLFRYSQCNMAHRYQYFLLYFYRYQCFWVGKDSHFDMTHCSHNFDLFQHNCFAHKHCCFACHYLHFADHSHQRLGRFVRFLHNFALAFCEFGVKLPFCLV